MQELIRLRFGDAQIAAVQGDLTKIDVDVVVNAANEHLSHGGGLAAAIARAAGPQLEAESRRWIAERGPILTGSTAVTTAGDMVARWVVHTVGPRYREGQDNAALLAAAVDAALAAATGLGMESVALPAVSAGIFGYPPGEATRVISATVQAWLASHPGSLRRVLLVGYDPATAGLFASALGSPDPLVDQAAE